MRRLPVTIAFNGAIDRDLLIIALALLQREVDRRKKLIDLRYRLQLLAFSIPLPKFFGCRIGGGSLFSSSPVK